MEVDDEAHPSTQPHRRNRRKKILISRNRKSGKNTSENQKKTLQHVKGDDSIQKHSYIDVNQEFTRFGNHSDILSLYKRLGRSLTSLLSSLRHEAHPHLAKMKT
jgi:hypothetical protein